MIRMRRWTDQQIEVTISVLLRIGVTFAAAIVVIGGILYLADHSNEISNAHIFRGEPADLRQVPGILHDVLALRGQGIIQLGILLLILTPVVRVAFSVFAFWQQRNRLYVFVTLIVLVVLIHGDAEICGRICDEAFTTLHHHHQFPPDFPTVEVAIELLHMLFSHPNFYCVVAEIDGQIVGSNCMDERSTIAGIGPISIASNAQNRSIGRLLMRAVMNRAAERGFAGIRLLQAAFHNRSLSLYTKLGFDAREPIVLMQGAPIKL